MIKNVHVILRPQRTQNFTCRTLYPVKMAAVWRNMWQVLLCSPAETERPAADGWNRFPPASTDRTSPPPARIQTKPWINLSPSKQQQQQKIM